jgi:hypothetical protein
VGGDPGGHRGNLPGLRLVEHVGTSGCPPGALRPVVAGDGPFLAGLFARNEGLPDADHCCYEDLVASAGHWMRGERNPGRPGVDHRLHQHRHPGWTATSRAPVVIRADSLGLRGREAPVYRVGQAVGADVEERLV